VTPPKRVQMSRQVPWRAENPDAVIVARPSRWGNPFPVAEYGRPLAVALYRSALLAGRLAVTVADVRAELAGRDVACWCGASDACHGDALLEVARSGASIGRRP
jgi:Domain of unknown function (DUF4326)